MILGRRRDKDAGYARPFSTDTTAEGRQVPEQPERVVGKLPQKRRERAEARAAQRIAIEMALRELRKQR